MQRNVAGDQQAGLSLLEVMVAVVVLSIAVVGLYRVFDQSALSVASDRDRLLAGLVAHNRAEELQLGLQNLSRSATMADREWQVESRVRATVGGFEEIEIVVQPETGSAGARLVTYRRPEAGQ